MSLTHVGTYLHYHSSRVCVVCGNGDFTRVDWHTGEKLQIHKLNTVELRSSGHEMMLCPSHYYDIKEALK